MPAENNAGNRPAWNHSLLLRLPRHTPHQLIGWFARIRRKLLSSKPRATLAQLVERLIRNQQVAGSIPAGGSI
jgi:hypothetical protein